MELEELQARARAAREFEVPIGEHTFRLRVPTAYEAELLAEENGFSGKRAPRSAMVRVKRAMVETAVVGWSGPRQRDVVEDLEGDEAMAPLAWSPAAVVLLLDAKPEWQVALWEQLLERIEARKKKREDAAKNSGRASTEPEAMRATSPSSASAD